LGSIGEHRRGPEGSRAVLRKKTATAVIGKPGSEGGQTEKGG